MTPNFQFHLNLPQLTLYATQTAKPFPLFSRGFDSETDLKPCNRILSTSEQTAPTGLSISLLNTNCQKSQKSSFFPFPFLLCQ